MFSFELAERNIHNMNVELFSFELQDEMHENKSVHVSLSEVTNPSSNVNMGTNRWKILTKPLIIILR